MELTYDQKFQAACSYAQSMQDERCLTLCNELIEQNPNDGKVYALMGEAALNMREPKTAYEAFKLARILIPSKFISLRQADALNNMGFPKRAQRILNSLRSNFIGTIDAPLWAQSMGDSLRCSGDYERAEQLLQYCIQEVPNWSVPYGSYAALLLRQHRYSEHVEYMRKQYELKPNWKLAHEYGMALPFVDDWKGAYKLWREAGQQRWGDGQFLGTKLWDGQPCKILRVYGDGGLGDTIQYSRYLLEAKKICQRVIFCPQKRHLEVVKALNLPGIDIVEDGGEPGDYASWLMVMMGAVGLFSPDQSPTPTRFKDAPRQQKAIAISWYGDFKHANDRIRSVKLDDFAPLINQFPEYEWFTVLPGEKTRQDIKKSKLPVKQYEGTLSEACQRLLTAQAYVGVDTGHAHVTATQDIPTHVIFKEFVDSRWGADKETTGYYTNSMWLYRSYRDGWAKCLETIAGRLHETDRCKTQEDA